jgi:hypothetical protein
MAKSARFWFVFYRFLVNFTKAKTLIKALRAYFAGHRKLEEYFEF